MNDASTIHSVPDVTSETAVVNGVRLHYLISGEPDGPPVLLWHGFLNTCQSWRKVVPILTQAGCSVLAPDMRGYGDSDKPGGVEGYDDRALAEEFRALVRKIDFGRGKPLILVAHDMGAPPALLWAADYPEEVAGLLYLEMPVMLADVLQKIIAFTPEAAQQGSMWWWLLPLAPGAPEELVVGNERAFLTHFYKRFAARTGVIGPAEVDETLRTFAGREGVLGAMGVYRTAFTNIEQTEPLAENQVTVPVVALGGEKSMGEKVKEMLSMVAKHVSGGAVPGCGHFLPEECPEEIVRQIQTVVGKR